jgi:hypothetical protein
MSEAKTPLEQALRSLPLEHYQETLELIQKLTQNVVRNPGEEKFRKIKLTNPKISAAITIVPGAVNLLKEMGWEEADEELVLPASVRLAHEKEIVGIIDAKDWYKKEVEKEHKRQMMARKEQDPEKEALRLQMETDRKEKAAEGPVTKGSVAQKLGDGPNITRAGDIGIGKSSGG